MTFLSSLYGTGESEQTIHIPGYKRKGKLVRVNLWKTEALATCKLTEMEIIKIRQKLESPEL